MVTIPLPIARRPFDPSWPVYSLDEMNIECSHCHAFHWKAESLTSSTDTLFKFGMCCYQGKIALSPLDQPPPELQHYLTDQDDASKHFRDHIRNYNYALAMTSVGRDLNYAINQRGGGPYTFILEGQLSHLAGSLLPAEREAPKYAQLYIHDSDVALQHRMQHRHNRDLDPFIFTTCLKMCILVFNSISKHMI